jgi:uncharacterized membrane protein YfhO
MSLEIEVPDGARPALVTFSRPYFSGYKARLGSEDLSVDSYRGLFPMVEIPSGMRGRLLLSYRPWWLVWGVPIALLSFTICVLSVFDGLRNQALAARAGRSD